MGGEKKIVSKSKNLLDKPIPDLGGRVGRGWVLEPPHKWGVPLHKNHYFPTTDKDMWDFGEALVKLKK